MITTYSNIVGLFESAVNEHLALQTFRHGTIDQLDASAQNVAMPYVYLRPLASPGLQGNTRALNFELYVLDIPKLSDPDALKVMSNTELYLYDVIAYIKRGSQQQTYQVDLTGIAPVNEAFQDRMFGWVGTINITQAGRYDFCNYPKLA